MDKHADHDEADSNELDGPGDLVEHGEPDDQDGRDRTEGSGKPGARAAATATARRRTVSSGVGVGVCVQRGVTPPRCL